MIDIAQKERETQNRVIKLFQEELGYRYLGNWEDREDNDNLEDEILFSWLTKRGHSKKNISKALYKFNRVVQDQNRSQYDVNKDVYSMLRYGVNIQPEAGENNIDVYLIDWEYPENNDFAIAEEVTIDSRHYKKRPDIVIYINGIAICVIELKRSTVSIHEGIRQNLDNQKEIFIKPFFNTVQMIMAGNDLEGIRYGVIETKEKYYLKWKEVDEKSAENFPYLLESTNLIRERADKYEYLLDKHIVQLLNKERLLEFIHDFMVFDRGIKKICRHNQYLGVKAAQDYVRRKEGGIIWHTQGSGKSLTMVWLTKWIREQDPHGRVLIITDRDELDKQIEKVYMGVSEEIYRNRSGKDLLDKLNQPSPWLMCSLIHKFGNREEGDVEGFLETLKKNIPENFEAKGNFYVFVDECHRTQTGKLHESMKAFLPNALFYGFTGTPILKTDKQTSLEIFGKFIHTYKFDEAVKDEVVLDLKYEARDIEQDITSAERIDEWFDLKTKGLTKFAKTELKQKWGTLRKVFSSRDRLEKIVMDILMDMEKKERLQNGRGNALLVSDSIYNACRYFELFQKGGFHQCAIVTSFIPSHTDIKGEETGEGDTEKIQQFEIYRKMISVYFNEDPDKAINRVDQFEDEVKKKFVNEPAQMKLLIVVNKLLTGFDAPSATYLYIDRKMRDHGLFQAVCRVNRLDGDDKDYGYIVDYMDLFKSLEIAYNDFTSGAFDQYEKEDVEGLLKDRLKTGKEQLENAQESIWALCEAVEPPKKLIQHIHYFCGENTEDPEQIKNTEPRRVALYKMTISLIRAYANIADEMEGAGYTKEQAEKIHQEIKQFENLRKQVQLASGDYIDLKKYEPAMRQLLDNYIGAEEARALGNFDEKSLVELLVKYGEDAIDQLPEDIKKDKEVVAETIELNNRKVIVEERPTNPVYYEKMSELLEQLIRQRRESVIEYEEYLQKIIELSSKIKEPDTLANYPDSLNSKAKKALYDNLGSNEELALKLDDRIMRTKKDGWRDHKIKQKGVRLAIEGVLKKHDITDESEIHRIFELVKNQAEY